MTEKSIKELMDERFGVGQVPRDQVPRRKVSRGEMDSLIAEAKERGKTKSKKSRPTGTESTEGTRDTDGGCMDNYPCPSCKEIKWSRVPDGSGRYYCLKCGEIIQYPSSEAKDAKEITDSNIASDPVSSCDGTEKKADQINPVNEQTTRTDKNKFLIYCEYRCNDCQEIIVASGNNLEKARTLVAFHKGCGGKLIFVRRVNPKIAENKERFSNPRVERSICNGCPDDMGACPRTYKRMVTCLLNNMDYKMKWLRGG